MNRILVAALVSAVLAVAPVAGASPVTRTEVSDSGMAGIDPTALDDEDRRRLQQQVRQRRVQMNIHQTLAMILIPVLGTTAAVGTINRVGMDTGQAPPAWAFDLHRGLAIGTTALYLSTAMFAVTAPNPMRHLLDPAGRGKGFDSSKFHRVLAVIHAAFFVGLVITGIVDARAQLSPEAYSALSKLHVIEGWTVFTLVTVSGITIARF